MVSIKKKLLIGLSTVLIFTQLAVGAPFREYPIGDSVEKNQMEIAAVWLPPVKMKMKGSIVGMEDIRKKKKGQSIHIEADIHAIEGNANGFGVGEWMPFLDVRYEITSRNGATISGNLFPMVAKDGPHYAAQVYVPFGKYKLTYYIAPPNSMSFGRHTDAITGVAKWWKPFNHSWDFEFKGAKK